MRRLATRMRVMWQVALIAGLTVCMHGCLTYLYVQNYALLNGTSRDREPIRFVDSEFLDPPAVAFDEPVYRPTQFASYGLGGETGNQAAGFFVTLETDDPAIVMFALVDSETGIETSLARVATPASDYERTLAEQPTPFNVDVRDQLLAGGGVFWLTGTSEANGQHRFGVLVAEELRPTFARLDMSAPPTDDGGQGGVTSIELADAFYYVAIIGDSVMWGNGLEEADKYTTLTIEAIEHETHRRVIWQRYAQSGSDIVPPEGDVACYVDCNGEVPTTDTSVTLQVNLIERPDLMELVLMNGCINDVGLLAIIDPETDEVELEAQTRQFCDEEMENLLALVRGRAPRARIVVTGYYPIFGPESDLPGLRAWLTAQGSPPTAEDQQNMADVARQSEIFHRVSHEGLRAACRRANDAAGEECVVFADPGFGPENALFMPEEWLWGLTTRSNLDEDVHLAIELFPEDPLSRFRSEACWERAILGPRIACLYTSVGHPNVTGARVYTDAIIAKLREIGVLPPAPLQSP